MPYLNLDDGAATPIAATLGFPTYGGEETLKTLREELSQLLGDRPDIDPDRLDKWINFAYRDIASLLDLPELDVRFGFDTVAGQSLYTLPTTVKYIRKASISDTATYPTQQGRTLDYISIDTYRRLPEVLGDVAMYGVDNKLLFLYPAPSAVRSIAIEAAIIPQRMTEDTQSPIFGPEWNEVILQGARARGFDAMMEWDNGAQAQNVYIASIRSKRNTKAENRTNEVAAFRPARDRTSRYRYGSSKGDY